MIIAPDAEQKKDNLQFFLVTLFFNMRDRKEEEFLHLFSSSIKKILILRYAKPGIYTTERVE